VLHRVGLVNKRLTALEDLTSHNIFGP